MTTNAYVVGHITVKDPNRWAEYRRLVSDTLSPWRGEVLFRGRQTSVLDGSGPHPDIVVIRFPDLASLNAWHASPAYQALIALRRDAADMDLLAYES